MSASGFTVYYVLPHSGHQQAVYWTRDVEEARSYARMIVKNNGHLFKVYLSTLEDGVISEWTVHHVECNA